MGSICRDRLASRGHRVATDSLEHNGSPVDIEAYHVANVGTETRVLKTLSGVGHL